MNKQTSIQVVLMAVLSSVLMATYPSISKLSELSPEGIAFYRLGIAALFMCALIFLKTRNLKFIVNPSLRSIMSGFFFSGMIVFYIKATVFLSMSSAVMMVFIGPVLATLIGRFLFSEYLSPLSILCVIFSFLGLGVMQFDTGLILGEINEGTWFGVGSGLCYALFIITNKFDDSHSDKNVNIFNQLMWGALITVPFLTFNDVAINIDGFFWVIAAGLIPGFLAILLAVTVIRQVHTALFTAISYIEPITVGVIGLIIWEQGLTHLQLLGMSIMILSGLCSIFIQKRPDIQKNSVLARN